jgi:hypothetical protein
MHVSRFTRAWEAPVNLCLLLRAISVQSWFPDVCQRATLLTYCRALACVFTSWEFLERRTTAVPMCSCITRWVGPTSQDFEGDSLTLPFLNLFHCQPGPARCATHISVIQSQGNVREAGSKNIFPKMCSQAESFERGGVLRKPMCSCIIRQAGPTSQDFEGDSVTSPFLTLVHYQRGPASGATHISVI